MANPSNWLLRVPILAGALLWLALGNSGSTGARHAANLQNHQNAKTQAHRWLQFGRASWYGNQFQGQQTASGEIYDMQQLTCAHRSLPLGALVLVTNLRNHRSVLVRVNDRGPALGSRIVDLSYAAAKILRFQGIAHVRLDLIDPSPGPALVAQVGLPAGPA